MDFAIFQKVLHKTMSNITKTAKKAYSVFKNKTKSFVYRNPSTRKKIRKQIKEKSKREDRHKDLRKKALKELHRVFTAIQERANVHKRIEKAKPKKSAKAKMEKITKIKPSEIITNVFKRAKEARKRANRTIHYLGEKVSKSRKRLTKEYESMYQIKSRVPKRVESVEEAGKKLLKEIPFISKAAKVKIYSKDKPEVYAEFYYMDVGKGVWHGLNQWLLNKHSRNLIETPWMENLTNRLGAVAKIWYDGGTPYAQLSWSEKKAIHEWNKYAQRRKLQAVREWSSLYENSIKPYQDLIEPEDLQLYLTRLENLKEFNPVATVRKDIFNKYKELNNLINEIKIIYEKILGYLPRRQKKLGWGEIILREKGEIKPEAKIKPTKAPKQEVQPSPQVQPNQEGDIMNTILPIVGGGALAYAILNLLKGGKE